MTHEEFQKRYSNHPMGHAFKACEIAQDFRELHIYYITAKTTVHLLRYQQELTQAEEDSLIEMLHRITDGKLGTQEAAH